MKFWDCLGSGRWVISPVSFFSCKWLVVLCSFDFFRGSELDPPVVTGSPLGLTEKSFLLKPMIFLVHWACWTIHIVWFFWVVFWLPSFQTSVLSLFFCIVMWNGTLCLIKDYFEHFYLFYPLLCKSELVPHLIQQDDNSLFS